MRSTRGARSGFQSDGSAARGQRLAVRGGFLLMPRAGGCLPPDGPRAATLPPEDIYSSVNAGAGVNLNGLLLGWSGADWVPPPLLFCGGGIGLFGGDGAVVARDGFHLEELFQTPDAAFAGAA